MVLGITGAAAVLAVAFLAISSYSRAKRRARAGEIRDALVPEIRELMRTADPSGVTDGDPATPKAYRALETEVPAVLSKEQAFAVQAFYRSVESYRHAREGMIEAFQGESEPSLGDRIRAKDARDRGLKDVYYAGEGAIQRLDGAGL